MVTLHSKPPHFLHLGTTAYTQHTQTDTRTMEHAASVGMGQIYTTHAMQPKKNNKFYKDTNK